MNKTKIEWTNYTWNPIKGICPVGCWYCYARRMYQRFKWNPEIRIADEYPNIISMALYNRKNEINSGKIFVCSTFELFHPLVKKEWRDWVFDNIKYSYHLTFQILTKFPQNIDRPMPDNVWLGVSITGEDEVYDRYQGLIDAKARIKFISFEPLFKPVYLPIRINWAIIGRLTGYGHKYDPPLSLLKIMVNTFKCYKIPIFLKDNLKDIWGSDLIQEFPK